MFELIVSVCIILIVTGLTWCFFHKQEKRRDDLFRKALSTYEESCKDNCRTTQDVVNNFLSASKEQMGSLKELHKKTLEILSGEQINV